MYRKILSGFLLLFCLNISNVASADEAVDNQTTNQTSAQVEEADADDFFNFNISNLPQLDTENSSVNFSSLTKGIYIADDDVAANFVLGFIGTKNLPDYVKNSLAKLGFTKEVEQFFIFQYLAANVIYVYVFAASIAGLFIFKQMLLDAASPRETLENVRKLRAKKLVTLVVSPFMHGPSLIVLVYSILIVIAFSNKFQTINTANQSEKLFSTVPTTQDKFNTVNNSTEWTQIAISNMRTRQGLMAESQMQLGDRDRFFNKVFGGETVEEALTDFNKYQKLYIESVNTTSVNIDATTKLSNIVNIVNLTSSVTLYKKDEGYSVDERSKFGYPATVGTVELNSSTENFENLSGTSLNDGTLAYQIQAAVKNAAENNNDLLISNSEKAYEILYPLFLNGNVNSSSLFEDSEQYPQLAALRKSVNTAAKKLAKDSIALVKMDELGTLPAEAKLQLSGLSSAAVMAGIQGADGSGKQTSRILNYFTKIAESKLNQDCTERYSSMKANKVNVEKINAARDQDAQKFFSRQEMQNIVNFACAWVRDSDSTVIALGSDKPEDALKYKAEAMARKAAWDFVALSALEGVKQNANEDKSYQNALASATLRTMKLGIIGYPLDAVGQARVADSINRRNSFISNSVYVRYLGPRVEENTFVNTEILFNQKDLDGESEDAKTLNNRFWPINLLGIISQSSVDLSALTPETESSISAKLNSKMKEIAQEITGTDFDSLKPAFGGDPNLSTHEAAKACLAAPSICDQRGTQSLITTVSNLGEEVYSYGFKVLIINSAFKIVSVGTEMLKDGASDVGESVTVALGKDGAGKGAAIGKFLGTLGKSAIKLLADLVVAITDSLTIIAFFMIPFGIFLKFILPMMPLFYTFTSLIKLFTNVPFYAFFFAPLYFCRMLTARTNDEFDANFKGLTNGFLSLVYAIPALMISLIIYYGVVNNFKFATPLRWILGSEVGGIIGIIISGFIAVASIVFILMNVLKEVTHGKEAVLRKFDYTENVEQEVSRMAQSLTDQRIIDIIRAGKASLDQVSNDQKANNKIKALDKVNKRNARQAFHQKAGTQGMGSGSD